MSEVVIVSLMVAMGLALWLAGVSLYCHRLVIGCVDGCHNVWVNRRGPRATGRPIEDIAMDLRRLLREHDRLTHRSAGWQSAHHRRACELAVSICAEEAATALGLESAVPPADRTSTVELSRRLRQLADAGLVLPQTALPGRDSF